MHRSTISNLLSPVMQTLPENEMLMCTEKYNSNVYRKKYNSPAMQNVHTKVQQVKRANSVKCYEKMHTAKQILQSLELGGRK